MTGEQLPRVKRSTILGFPHLVKAYANGGARIFETDEDYSCYLSTLRQLSRDKLVKVYAFCLMPEEVRLVLRPTRLSLARIMQRLHGTHTQRMNRVRGRLGHLFRGRFDSLVFPHKNLLEVVRSVHLWPVRTGAVRRAEHYGWCSHAGYLNKQAQWSDMVCSEDILGSLSNDSDSALRSYFRFIESAALDPDNDGIAQLSPGVGGIGRDAEELVGRLRGAGRRPRRLSLIALARRVSLLLNVSMTQLQGPSRRQDIVMARRLLASAAVLGVGRSVSEVAHFVERDKAQVSRLVSQGVDLYECDEPFRTLVDSVRGNQAKPLDGHT